MFSFQAERRDQAAITSTEDEDSAELTEVKDLRTNKKKENKEKQNKKKANEVRFDNLQYIKY